MPLFVGPEGTAPLILARYLELQPLLEPIGRQPQSLALSPREAWQLRLDDGVLLDLGRDQAKSRVNERLQRVAGNHRQGAGRRTGRADGIGWGHPDGIAMRGGTAREGNK